MRLPEEANRWKSDGRLINLDLNDPSINALGESEDKHTTLLFAEWLRSNGWTVSTQHSGQMQIGGRNAGQDESVAELERLLLDEFYHSGCVY